MWARSVQDLQNQIEALLIRLKNTHGLTYETKGLNNQFYEAIMKISEQEGKPVVILVDEYNKPILDQIENPSLATQLREELKNFYGVIKGADEYLKFVFLTDAILEDLSEDITQKEDNMNKLEVILEANDITGLRDLFHSFLPPFPVTGTGKTSLPDMKAITPASCTAISWHQSLM